MRAARGETGAAGYNVQNHPAGCKAAHSVAAAKPLMSSSSRLLNRNLLPCLPPVFFFFFFAAFTSACSSKQPIFVDSPVYRGCSACSASQCMRSSSPWLSLMPRVAWSSVLLEWSLVAGGRYVQLPATVAACARKRRNVNVIPRSHRPP